MSEYICKNKDCTCCEDMSCACGRICEWQSVGEDTITVGATVEHVFKLNFSYSELCAGFEVIYKNGLTNSFVISSSALGAPFKVEEEDGRSYITVTLSPELTSTIVPYRDTFAQMKLNMKDGTVIFGDMNKLRVIDTLSEELA